MPTPEGAAGVQVGRRTEEVERPEGLGGPLDNAPRFGSDLIAQALQALDVPFVALNPGSSFRGLHDSLVNHLGNAAPQLLLCLHEEHAVAIAHGYAKVSGRPMGAIVHSNVGLMHATMAVYNAWCDRVPLLLLGATGPVDAAKRRPWIDWLHTAQDQAALIRPFIKWDDQPASAAAAVEALYRAKQVACTAPAGPVYVNFDVELQEAAVEPLSALPEVARHRTPVPAAPDPDELVQAADRLSQAQRPVILVGRVSRDLADWQARIALAERLGAQVITDLKVGAGFPTEHPLHCDGPSMFLGAAGKAALAEADAILSLDWVDLGGTLAVACGAGGAAATVVHASPDQYLHNGWSKDHQAPVPADHLFLLPPDRVVSPLLAALGPGEGARPPAVETAVPEDPATSRLGPLVMADLAAALRAATQGRALSLLRLPIGWAPGLWPFRHPLDYLGYDGGGGIGSGPGMAVGGALALRNSDRLPVAVLGDGDFLMGLTAIWTAVHYRVPLMIVVANNRSFFNDELHQERVARQRGRPVENKWIGQAIDDPAPDLAKLAEGQGAAGFGPVTGREELAEAFAAAVAAVEAGGVAVVDVSVASTYDDSAAGAVTREKA